MPYVVLMPHSSTNNSGKFRVVSGDDWIKYVNGASSNLPIAGSFDKFDEAEARKDELNNEV